jgi:hypothetical protein
MMQPEGPAYHVSLCQHFFGFTLTGLLKNKMEITMTVAQKDAINLVSGVKRRRLIKTIASAL